MVKAGKTYCLGDQHSQPNRIFLPDTDIDKANKWLKANRFRAVSKERHIHA